MYDNSSTRYLYVPIDFGKNVNWYGGRSGTQLERVWPDRQVYNHRHGYNLLAHDLSLARDSGVFSDILVGYEPTGVYHEAWVQALLQDFGSSLQVRQIHPAASHAKRRELQHGRPRKSDPIDLDALCYCLRDGISSPAPQLMAEDLRFDVWCNHYEQLLLECARQKQRLGAQLDRLWPGLLVDVDQFNRTHPGLIAPEPLLRSRPLDRALLRALALQAPNPQTWCSWSTTQIQSFVRQTTGRCGPKTLQKIHQVLERGMYLPADLAELLAERLRFAFQAYLDLEERLTSLEQTAANLVDNSQVAVLLTIPGMSATLAARYRGHLCPMGRFSSAAQVWAFAGYEPSLNNSGDHHGKVKISMKGAPSLRDTLYLIGFHTRKRCPAIRRTYEKAFSHGKGAVGAIIHAAHKANRMCFHLYMTQQTYDPRKAC